ncbi:MAG TPA: branched-chain amino acid ABC transporter permease, partial [Ramlibacter sp.]|uniref:branched-chain amino acid ABC transporter permease n=1 Tax=Ramlibacter sp. TaxID=1917967 RepID=UPI002D7EA6CF
MPAAATASEAPAPARAWLARPRSGGTLLLAALVALAPLVLPNNYAYEIAIQVAINAVVCIGLNLLIGYAGQISLGHAGFFALGGYASAIFASRYGVPVWLSLPGACAAVGALAYLLGRPTLRLKGHPLAMATLGLGVIISIAITTEDRWTGGPDGMQVPPLVLFGLAVQGEQVWYWITGALLVATVWLALNLIDSPNGRALRALHGSEVAAQTLGIDCARFKLQVFTLSAVLAALAGALTAHYAGFITPAKASFLH